MAEFTLGLPRDIATMGFLRGASISIATRGFVAPIGGKIGDLETGGAAPHVVILNGIATFYYLGSDGLNIGGEAPVVTKIGGVTIPTVPGVGGVETGGFASFTTLLNGQFIAHYKADGLINMRGTATVVSKIAGQTSAVYVAAGLLLVSGEAKQEFIKFLKDLFPPQPPLPGPPPVAPLTLPEYVIEQDPITQFQKDDISSGLLEVGGGQMHLFPLQLFGNRDWEFVILIRPWSRAVDFTLEIWISDKPLGAPIGRIVNVTYREITFIYIKEKSMEVWQGENRIFHAIVDLQSQGNFFLHVDNLENRKVNKYAMKIETFIYGQTIFDGDTTIFDLVNDTETVFDRIGEFGRETEGNVEL